MLSVMQWGPKPGFQGANSHVPLSHCTSINRLFNLRVCGWGEECYILGLRVFISTERIYRCKVLIATSGMKQVLWKCYPWCYYLQVLSSLDACLIRNSFSSGSGNHQGKIKLDDFFFLTKKNCFGGNQMQYSGNRPESDFR